MPIEMGRGPAEALAEALRSELLSRAGFRHGFFTRRGGVSAAPWDTLSFAVSVGDAPEAVRENLRRAAQALGVDASKLYMLSQVHGTDAHELAGDEDPGEVVRRVGDITLAHAAGVACGVRSADCVPILLAHPPSGAVAAIHSGWRGTVKDAAAAGVQALRARVAGDEPRGVFEAEILAAIGPHIEACCFEVGEDVAASLAACSPLGAAAVSHPGGDGAKPHVDLRRIVRSQLEAAGLRADRVDDVPGCTVCDRASFHSFRRDGARSGRMLSAIVTAAGEGAARG